MSKKVKGLITNELTAKFKGVETLGVINPRGIDGIKTNGLRRRMRAKGLRMTVVKNSLVRRAVGDGKLKGFEKLLNGPSALVHGEGSVASIARFLLAEKKNDEKLEIRGVFFDGEVFEGDKGIERASKMPTRQEAIANVLGLILGPGRKLAGAIKGPGGTLGAMLKTIEEKAKTKEGAPAPA
jgi:large subunit ribosomal protein L10